jgi:hypothetical protein
MTFILTELVSDKISSNVKLFQVMIEVTFKSFFESKKIGFVQNTFAFYIAIKIFNLIPAMSFIAIKFWEILKHCNK